GCWGGAPATAAGPPGAADRAAADIAARADGAERAHLAFAVTRDGGCIDGGIGGADLPPGHSVARPSQHLAHVVGIGATKAGHYALVGIAFGGGAVGRAAVETQ